MNFKKVFLRWEWILVLLILGVYIFFQNRLPDTYSISKLMDQTRVYMVDVGFMALGTMLILMLGDIDISIASTAALSVTIMGIAYRSGIPFVVAMLMALIVGAACGCINGLLVARFKELYPMIITLATQTIFRGVAYLILKDDSVGSFPRWFSKDLGYGKLFGSIPIMLVCLLACFPFFYVWIHHTPSGRRIFATGANAITARYSGIRTDRIKVLLYTLNGILAACGGIFLTARTGSVKYNIGAGYEMQAIAIAVLGGASTQGGKGSVIGVLLSLILMTCLKNGLMLVYNDSFILNLAIGALMILVVLLPNIVNTLRQMQQVRQRRRESSIF